MATACHVCAPGEYTGQQLTVKPASACQHASGFIWVLHPDGSNPFSFLSCERSLPVPGGSWPLCQSRVFLSCACPVSPVIAKKPVTSQYSSLQVFISVAPFWMSTVPSQTSRELIFLSCCCRWITRPLMHAALLHQCCGIKRCPSGHCSLYGVALHSICHQQACLRVPW